MQTQDFGATPMQEIYGDKIKDSYREINISHARWSKKNYLNNKTFQRMIRSHLRFYHEVSPGVAGIHERINMRGMHQLNSRNIFPYGTTRSRSVFPDSSKEKINRQISYGHVRAVYTLETPWKIRHEIIRLRRIHDRFHTSWYRCFNPDKLPASARPVYVE